MNNIAMPMLCGFHWYLYFGAQVELVAFEEANEAIASERSILSKNQDSKSFICVAVNPLSTYISGSIMYAVAEN